MYMYKVEWRQNERTVAVYKAVPKRWWQSTRWRGLCSSSGFTSKTDGMHWAEDHIASDVRLSKDSVDRHYYNKQGVEEVDW